MIVSKQNLTGKLIDKQSIQGKINKATEYIKPITQEKTIVPTKQIQEVLPDENVDLLSKVIVNAIPNEYIVPQGEIEITENGTVDVSNYANANVNVPTPTPSLQSKSVTITENGTTTITADNGYDGLDEVEVTTNVSGGDITHEEYLEDVELARSILEDFDIYEELEYIQSTGTQYIDTQYYPNQDTKIEMVIETINLTNTFVPFGTREDGRLDYIAGINFNNQNYIQFNTNNAEYFGNSNSYLNAKLKITLYNGTFIIEDIENPNQKTQGNFTERGNFTCITPLYFGCLNNNGEERYLNQKYKLYSAKIYENNFIIKDYIPTINKINDKVCLYEKIEQEFLYNKGEEDFIGGGAI